MKSRNQFNTKRKNIEHQGKGDRQAGRNRMGFVQRSGVGWGGERREDSLFLSFMDLILLGCNWQARFIAWSLRWRRKDRGEAGRQRGGGGRGTLYNFEIPRPSRRRRKGKERENG